MPYHELHDPDTLLVCPNCHSMNIVPIEEAHSWSLGEDGTEIYDKDKENDPYLDDYYVGNLRNNYIDSYNHEPKPEQEHFMCKSCDDYLGYEAYHWDGSIVHPFHKLKRIPISEIQDVDTKNPYDDWFK